jgi:hypothetical protein
LNVDDRPDGSVEAVDAPDAEEVMMITTMDEAREAPGSEIGESTTGLLLHPDQRTVHDLSAR